MSVILRSCVIQQLFGIFFIVDVLYKSEQALFVHVIFMLIEKLFNQG